MSENYNRHIEEAKKLKDTINNIKQCEQKKLEILINKINSEIGIINSKREQLWKQIKQSEEILKKIGLLYKTEYDKFTREELFKIDVGLVLSNYENDLKQLKSKMEDTRNRIENSNWKWKPLEKRKISAYFIAQNRQFVYLRAAIKKYGQDLELKINYYEDCLKIAEEYRQSINNIEDKLRESKLEENLKIVELFLRTQTIVETFKNKKNIDVESYEDIEIKKLANILGTKYERFYKFTQGIFVLNKSLSNIFKNDILTSLIKVNDYEKNAQDVFCDLSYERDCGFWFTGETVWDIDTDKELEEFPLNEIKVVSFQKEELEEKKRLLEKAKEDIKENEKFIEDLIEEKNKNYKNVSLKSIFFERQKLQDKIDTMYLEMLKNIEKEIKNLNNLEQTFKKDFLEACAMDISGELVRTFFDMSDYNITVDQLFRRITDFSYENEFDPLGEEIKRRKNLFNLENSRESMENLKRELGEPDKLFVKQEVESADGKTRKEYIDKKLIQNGKDEYKEKRARENGIKDEIGTSETLDVDHIQPLATARIYSKYIKEDRIDKIKQFYNSEDNFQFLGRTANQCKGDAKVVDKDGNDITYKATPEQLTEAIVKKLEGNENRSVETKKKLQDDGILDETGKVYPHIKRKIGDNAIKSQNKESLTILKNTDYGIVGKTAVKETGKQIYKIFAGQIIYYTVPPIIYEIRKGFENNYDSDSDDILNKLTESSTRIVNYISEKKSEIFSQFTENTLKKFLKNFFDIIINVVKATIKKILKMARQLIITVIDAMKILFDRTKTMAEKMDAILQLIAGLIVSIVCELLFEYLEKQFLIPESFLMPIQIITTIIASNFVMISLKKMDLFNTKEGFKREKILEIFREEREKNERLFKEALSGTNEKIESLYNEFKRELKEIKENLSQKNLFDSSIENELKRQFEIFGENINFQEDWEKFLVKV